MKKQINQQKDLEKVLKQLEEAVRLEVGDEPETLEEGDLRSSVWQALNVLVNFFK